MIKFTPAAHMRKIAKMRLQDEEELIEVFAKKYGIGYIDLTMYSIDTDALKLIPEDRARVANIAGFKLRSKNISLAVRSPLPASTQKEIKILEEKKYKVSLFMASKKSIEKA